MTKRRSTGESDATIEAFHLLEDANADLKGRIKSLEGQLHHFKDAFQSAMILLEKAEQRASFFETLLQLERQTPDMMVSEDQRLIRHSLERDLAEIENRVEAQML